MFSQHQHLYHLFRAVDVRVYVASNLLAVFYYICGIRYAELSYIRRSNTNYMFPARQTCMIRIETLSAYHAILAPVPHRVHSQQQHRSEPFRLPALLAQ